MKKITGAFPDKFTTGRGDVNDKVRIYDVSLKQASVHYIKLARVDDAGIISWPFGSDMRFCHYIQDMDERHRIQAQANIYLQKNPADANMTIADLKEMARGANNPTAFATDLRMQRYAANILGSGQYMSVRKKELIALMSSKKIATVWFTLSLANHHWADLQQLFHNKPIRLPDESDIAYDKRCKKVCMSNYADNPAIVNELFVRRGDS